MELVKDNLFVFFFDFFLLCGHHHLHLYPRQRPGSHFQATRCQNSQGCAVRSECRSSFWRQIKWVFRWNIWAVSWAVYSFRGKLERARPQSADLIQIWAIIAQVDEPSQRKQTRTGSGAQFAWEEAFSMWVSSSLFATFWAVISPSDFNKCFTQMEHISEKSQFTVQNFSSRFGTRWELFNISWIICLICGSTKRTFSIHFCSRAKKLANLMLSWALALVRWWKNSYHYSGTYQCRCFQF